jgi:alkanesulfonate monooxygenase SsuD/methylene tetrahydromethanopterin reductase-like flavin-dependent oxidoreductase (luciferase family)
MKIGVHLPNAIPGLTGERLLEWARRVDDSSLSSVAVADRLDYATMDGTIALTAAASVTSRVELMSCGFIAPTRPPAIFAKEVASLSLLAPGRFALGVVVGGRTCDYEAAGVPWERRGRILDEALDTLAAMRQPADPPQSLGPQPAPMQVLIGGASPGALRRLVKHGDGYIGGGVSPKIFSFEVGAVRQAWQEAGKPGQPRVVASTWACSPNRADEVEQWRDTYFVKGGPPEFVRAEISCGPDAVLAAVEAYTAEGADEVQFFLGTDDLAELDWLIDTVSPLTH